MTYFYVEQKGQPNFIPDEAEETSLSMFECVYTHTQQMRLNLRKPKADMIDVFNGILDECLFNFTRFLQTPVFCFQHCKCNTWQVVQINREL